MSDTVEHEGERMRTSEGREPLFDPRGMYWRVNRESVLLLGGGSALLLELAHPLVAAGVAQHSDFQRAPLNRLLGTIRAMQRIVHGERAQALATVERINRMHRHIRGVLPEGTAEFPAGTPYCASDPELLRWVWATLVHTSLTAYQVFLEPLDAGQRDGYYQEAKTLARLFGVPDSLLPEDLVDFEAYWREMIEGPTLEITPTARALGDEIIHPPILGFPRWLGEVTGIATLGLLEPVIRERYGFRWSSRRGRAWRLSRGVLARTVPRMPDLARISWSARRAERALVGV